MNIMAAEQSTPSAEEPAASEYSTSFAAGVLASPSSLEDGAVLARILRFQEGKGKYSGPTFLNALSEIRAGRKRSHWIWYVWPTLKGTRTTRMPGLMLPGVGTARHYLEHETLGPRLLRITEVATRHLVQGVRPNVLFGSGIDAEKFLEVCTCFYIAASAASGEGPSASLVEAAATFKAALVAARAGLDAHTVAIAAKQGWPIPPPPRSGDCC